jgi:tryptophanyl-tRNA synthetase
MSKSLGNTVGILDEPETIRERVRTAVTDPQRVRKSDPGRPEVCNVYSLHKHFSTPELLQDIADQCRGATRGCVQCKGILADSISERFGEFRTRAAEYRAHPERVIEILDAGASRARVEAAITLEEARRRMGMNWRASASTRDGS